MSEKRKRKRLESLCITEDGDQPYDLVTNMSFLSHKLPRELTDECNRELPYNVLRALPGKISIELSEKTSSRKTHVNVSNSVSVNPMKSPSSASTITVKVEQSASPTQCSIEVVNMLATLDLLPNPKQVDDRTHWYHRLRPLIENFIERCTPGMEDTLGKNLKNHLYRSKNGDLSVSLEAAASLRIHPDICEVQKLKTNSCLEILPSPIREKLVQGKFVSMKHILYGEALKLGFVNHTRDNKRQVPDPYPLDLENESPPKEFLLEICRPDIFRAFTSHALTLGSHFPRLAARMHNLIRHVWILIYQNGMEVQSAMDLYDAYFMEFERHLNLLTLMPMDNFPPYVIESALRNYFSGGQSQQ